MRPSQVAVDRQYWEQHLGRRPFVGTAFPDLPATGGSREPRRSELARSFRPDTAADLLRVANGSDVALFTLLSAGVRYLLHRYTQRRELALGTTLLGAAAPAGGADPRLLLANEIERRETFLALLQRERTVVLAARQHQGFPFARAQGWLKKNAAGDPGVEITLSNAQPAARSARPEAPIAFGFTHGEDGTIHVQISYSENRYGTEHVARLFRHLDLLLGIGCADPHVQLDDVDLLTNTERNALWTEQTGRVIPSSTLVAEFSKQVAGRGDRIALRCDTRELSYQELDCRSNQLARHLRAAGLRPDEPVGLYLTRSIEVVVGMLGILKAGGYYLPLDPAFPASRNRFMLDDAGSRLVLATAEPPPSEVRGEATWIDSSLDATWRANADDSALPLPAAPESIAYVLYTSGTTGQPKGVMVTHAGVVQLARSDQLVPRPGDERFLLQSALTFDASTIEIWTPLLNGAPLVIHPGNRTSLEDAVAFQRAESVSTVLDTTALFHVAAQETPPVLPHARTQLVGGDALSPRHAREFLRTFRGRLVNAYGPTECSAVSAWHEVRAADTAGDRVPIGRPLGATEVCILDASQRPVPAGVTGELYLGGPGVARGYLNRPALTAEHFIPHPFSSTPGARLYRSGDLGWYRCDGVIEFAGRDDNQVKVRGYRIELGEVENLLMEHRDIRAAAAVVENDANGSKRLLAFLVARNGHDPTGAEIREFLLTRTPEHQIPAAFYFRDSLPINAHGKVDRSHLRGLTTVDTPTTHEPPRSPGEHAMAAIWQQVLSRKNLGVHDDFFEAGGDSLLAMQVLARINKSGLSLPAREFFRLPTIAGCAAAARERVLTAPDTKTLRPPSGTVPLTPIQHWFFDHHPVDPHFFNLSIMLEVTGRVDIEHVARAVTTVIRHHDALQLVYTRHTTGWVAHYSRHPDDALFTVEDLSSLPAGQRTAEQTRRAADYQTQIDLARGPLFHAVLFQHGDNQRDRLLLVAHHLVIDLISWRIVLDDLDTALSQSQATQSVALAGGSDRFGDWARMLPTYLRSEAADRGRAYWLELADSFAAAPPPPRVTETAPEAFLHRYLTSADTAVLLERATAMCATMEDLLLATALLAHHSSNGASYFVVNLDRHGRAETVGDHNVDVSRTVGWFTAVVPVYLMLSGEPTLSSSLATVQKTLRQLPNRGVDFGLLRYLGTPKERQQLDSLPRPNMSLNYQGEFDQELESMTNLALSEDDAGEQRSEHHQRETTFDLDVRVVAGALEFHAIGRGKTAPSGAEHLLDAIVTTLETLARNPQAAKTHMDLTPLRHAPANS